MTEAPPPLFDVEVVRSLTVPTVGTMVPSAPTVVLGSTQHEADLDDRAIIRDGVSVRRRRGGGGAVLLRPDDCWVELWLPATSPTERGDVRSTAYRVGGWWEVALAGLGVSAETHRGGLRDAEQGAVACFAGLGPGELTVAGRKLVGLSQWRGRQGALVSSVVTARLPGELSTYLTSGAARVPQLKLATCLDEVLPGVGAERVADAFCRAVFASLPMLRQETRPFS
ncbi:MAG TPA: hypothetical protein VGZ33_06435 [Acidimicrobiales bacterium]|nr:hypothetical protein [Acidimicrobiales bacterium]